jgi:hypothetical protein
MRLKSVTLDIVAFATIAAFASPAFAGSPVTPAPIAGVGIGAIALIGMGYRALKRRAKR